MVKILPPIVISGFLGYILGLLPLLAKTLQTDVTRLPSFLNVLVVLSLITAFTTIGFTFGKIVNIKFAPVLSMILLYVFIQAPFDLVESESAEFGMSFKSIMPIWRNGFPHTGFLLEPQILIIRILIFTILSATLIMLIHDIERNSIFENIRKITLKHGLIILIPCIFFGLIVFRQPYLIRQDFNMELVCKQTDGETVKVCTIKSKEALLNDYFEVASQILGDFTHDDNATKFLVLDGIVDKNFSFEETPNVRKVEMQMVPLSSEQMLKNNAAMLLAQKVNGYYDCTASDIFKNMTSSKKSDVLSAFIPLENAIIYEKGYQSEAGESDIQAVFGKVNLDYLDYVKFLIDNQQSLAQCDVSILDGILENSGIPPQ
jgi:hypothetical protein